MGSNIPGGGKKTSKKIPRIFVQENFYIVAAAIKKKIIAGALL